MAKKKTGEKQIQMKNKSELQSEADSVKKILDLALLKAKRIHEKYDITTPENRHLFIPKR